MDPCRGKQQQTCRSHKSSNYQRGCHFGTNNYNTSSNNAYFRTTRIQKPSLKWRKEHHYVGSHRSRYPYRKSDVPTRKSNKSAEDMEEEERKKKLNDTAKKLLSKIETWNAEKNVTEEANKSREDSQSVDVNLGIAECDPRQGENKVGGDSKKRIAHSKKPKLLKNRTPKRLRQSAKATAKYDVNKAAVKDFQNRIQHKLIEEIMQMPKENLQNVLNDPKINPVMGLKMSRLVQENRPLITQKLRALAESKMKSLGFASNQQLLVDIDKLIDPVIETDLSVLPYELIKQMENLFQVQFDYSQGSPETGQAVVDICDSAEGNADQKAAMVMSSLESSDNPQNNLCQEDLSMYECSTDEDEELSASRGKHSQPPSASSNDLHCIQESAEAEEDTAGKSATVKPSGVFQQSPDGFDDQYVSGTAGKEELLLPQESRIAENLITLGPKGVQSGAISAKVFTSASSQTEAGSHADASTQTSGPPEESEILLYGLSLPKESRDDDVSSLLEEVKSIQNLTNRLNERRLMIFLELSKKNPKGNFVCDDKTKENFMETLSNGSVCLVEALEDFFKVRSGKNCENAAFGSKDCKWRSSGKWVNKSKSRKDR